MGGIYPRIYSTKWCEFKCPWKQMHCPEKMQLFSTVNKNMLGFGQKRLPHFDINTNKPYHRLLWGCKVTRLNQIPSIKPFLNFRKFCHFTQTYRTDQLQKDSLFFFFKFLKGGIRTLANFFNSIKYYPNWIIYCWSLRLVFKLR